MTRNNFRALCSLAAVGWLLVAGSGARMTIVEDAGDDWQIPYLVFAVGLVIAAALTTAAVWTASLGEASSRRGWIGLGVCSLGVLLSMAAAWAIPVWMALYAVGFALVAAFGSKPWRRAVYLLSGSQILGMAVMFAGIAAELGSADEYGDHPAAFGLGLIVTAAGTVGSLFELDRVFTPDAVVDESGALAAGVG